MQVTVHLEFKAERKEPLGALIRRVAEQFERAGVPPTIVASFNDGPGGITKTSAVERALKKYPHLARFERTDAPLPNIPSIRRLTNRGADDPFPIGDLLALADGVPRSLPFHAISVHFGHPDFGRVPPLAPGLAPEAGIIVGDSWWVNGRNRSLSAFYAVDADATSKKLPDPSGAIATVLSGFGKPRRSAQFIPPSRDAAKPTEGAASAAANDIAAITPIIAKYRAGMRSLLERLSLPHDLPPEEEARLANRGGSGPLKPALVAAFGPRGFDCRGGSGTFTLQHRISTNHIVELHLDVGTWSRSLTAMFRVRGPGFKATLSLPVSGRAHGGQYPIGDTANWEQIVANLAVIADELVRTFVKDIQAAVSPAPEWFDPGR